MIKLLMGSIRCPVFAGDVDYDRPKDPDINDTPISIDFFAGEEPTGLLALSADNGGSTGILNIDVRGAADGAAGDIQTLFRIEDLQVVVDPLTFRTRLTATITPILGDGSDGTPKLIDIAHDESMDAWQTAAGNPRVA